MKINARQLVFMDWTERYAHRDMHKQFLGGGFYVSVLNKNFLSNCY